jgi:hypothetical protein
MVLFCSLCSVYKASTLQRLDTLLGFYSSVDIFTQRKKKTKGATVVIVMHSRYCVFDQQHILKAVGESNTNSGEKM